MPTPIASLSLASATLAIFLVAIGATAAAETFVPCADMALWAPTPPSEAEYLAIRHAADEIQRFTGRCPTIASGAWPDTELVLAVGTAASLTPETLGREWGPGAEAPTDADLRCQFYAIEPWPHHEGERRSVIVVAPAGWGPRTEATPLNHRREVSAARAAKNPGRRPPSPLVAAGQSAPFASLWRDPQRSSIARTEPTTEDDRYAARGTQGTRHGGEPGHRQGDCAGLRR